LQDKYAGDIGDFIKLGLLRVLIAGSPAGNTLGINWYLAPDEPRRNDGNHVGYLQSTHRLHAKLLGCDDALLTSLEAVVDRGRSLGALLESGVLPESSLHHVEPIPIGYDALRRYEWHGRALETLGGADLIYLDPDIGVRDAPGASNDHKYVLMSELRDYLEMGVCVVLYQHANRVKGGVPVQVASFRSAATDGLGVAPTSTVVARRGSCRLFHIWSPAPRGEWVTRALEQFERTWFPHAARLQH
jgi:hypothetical protein